MTESGMAYVPDFAQQRAIYESEKAAIRTVEDWYAFNRRWFPTQKWPRKSDAQVRAESVNKRGPVDLGGRRWSNVTYSYDLTPEDRYEYVFTQRTIGDPLRYPEEQATEKTPADGWAQECPYDEISTTQIGDMTCPKCGRRLVFTRRAD
jgi:hypothetical protein